MSSETMDPTNSDVSANYVYGVVKEGEVIRLKDLLKYIKNDYDNPSCDYILRQCRNVAALESFLKDYSHLFIVEGSKVARYSEKLEIGQETADRYFEEKLKQYKYSIPIIKLKEFVEKAPVDIRNFIQTFYPENEFKHYLQRRPHIFFICNDGGVCLIERECAVFFRKIVNHGEGILFMSLRGNIGQAPEHVRKYINNHYAGTEFLNFLEINCDIFRINSNGRVFLVA